MTKGILLTALAALLVQPAAADARKKTVAVPTAPVQLPYQSANLPTSGQVRAFYAGWRYAPIWFNGTAAKPAANQLIEILKRAPLDGIPVGPQYAAQVQAAVQQAVVTGAPQAIAFADRTLSEALVLYAQVMQRPSEGYIYAHDYLKPKAPSADQVLRTASGAPSLEQYLSQVANPNAIYTSIRDAAWREMQASGSAAPDPRVMANLDRARIFPARGRFAIVDSATQRLIMYENGIPVDSMKVVVGDPYKLKLPTPMIASTMYYVVHNPYWNVPHHLVRRMAPNLTKASYRKAGGYEIMSDWTADATPIDPSSVDWTAVQQGAKQIRVRQKPSGENSMGDLKFPFDNPEGIFLHDTPKREYFQLAVRAKSNGCVRLEDARRFARWLLQREPVKPDDGAEQFEQMTRGVPVYTTYLTAQVENGQLSFVDDIYGWDPSAATQVAAGNAAKVAAEQ
ncbi:MAG TPA: L,D-transpeptidase family protein [Sphingomicrobium sp.]|nr:L,D-transpeptidase family protein [Sphingomicrobium sp.]